MRLCKLRSATLRDFMGPELWSTIFGNFAAARRLCTCPPPTIGAYLYRSQNHHEKSIWGGRAKGGRSSEEIGTRMDVLEMSEEVEF